MGGHDYYRDNQATLLLGDALDVLPTLADASVDAVVCDPPYELGFMGKAWDASGIAYNVDVWRHCWRVIRPGGHLVAFGGTRTYHRMAVAIEDAGFEIRDSLHWIYGSGFPKSLDVSKAIDKAAGAQREVISASPFASRKPRGTWTGEVYGEEPEHGSGPSMTAPATDDAKRWQGWGTALKPAHEPIVLARKPLVGTVAANVLEHGTGAINIDACRVAGERLRTMTSGKTVLGVMNDDGWKPTPTVFESHALGRWPANVLLCHGPDCAEQCTPGCPVVEMDRQSAGASRFFPVFRYQAKAPSKERPKVNGVAHPTVKPLALMRWLVRLVTPPGGTVLDPFAGSGATLEATILEGFQAIGIEREAGYIPLCLSRLARATSPVGGEA